MAPEGEGKDFLCKVKMTSNLNLQQELLMKPWLRTNYCLSLGEKDEGKQSSSSTEYKRRTIENYLPPSRRWGGEGGGRGSRVEGRGSRVGGRRSGNGGLGSGVGEFCVTIENWLPINCQCWGITGIKQGLVAHRCNKTVSFSCLFSLFFFFLARTQCLVFLWPFSSYEGLNRV